MFLKLNNVEMPETVEVVVDDFTITESARNDKGDMIHEFIATKKRVTASIGILTHAQRQIVYTQLAVNKGLSLAVTFNDPDTGAVKTIDCYVGDRSIKLAAAKNGVPTHWRDLQLRLIQN